MCQVVRETPRCKQRLLRNNIYMGIPVGPCQIQSRIALASSAVRLASPRTRFLIHAAIAMRRGMGDGRPSGNTRTLGTTIAALTFRRGGGGGRLDCWKKCHVSKADGMAPCSHSSPSRGAGGTTMPETGAALRPNRFPDFFGCKGAGNLGGGEGI